MNLSPLIISLKTAFLATVITFFLGIFAAHFVVKMKRFQGIMDAILTLPMVLPPTVVGFFLLLFFGKNSLIGKFLLSFDITFVFSWEATVVAAVVVSLPLMYRTTRGAFEQIDKNIIYAARTLGVSETKIFWRVILPNSWYGVMAGVILSFTRALGEFGATIMVAGNIPGLTQTMSTAIYSAVQAGDNETAFQWVLIVVMISFAVIMLLNYWTKNQNEITQKLSKKRRGAISVVVR
ncbi:MAG: molybdate transporter, permease protein [Firmicutes bacterium]|nr:molybdate transporter, permease protein [Bacillota bacterium]